MGKHEKKEEHILTANVMPDDFYKARIKTLEKENRELAKEVEALEDKEQKLRGCILEMREEMASLKEFKSKILKVVIA